MYSAVQSIQTPLSNSLIFISKNISPMTHRYCNWGGYRRGTQFLDASDGGTSDRICHMSAAVDPNDCRRLFVGSNQGCIQEWDLVQTKKIREWIASPNRSSVYALCHSTCQLLAVGCTGIEVCVWSTIDDPRCVFRLQNGGKYARNLSFNHNGTLLLTGSIDPTIRVWSMDTGRCIRVFSEHVSPTISVICGCIVDDPSLVITVSNESVKVWNTRSINDGFTRTFSSGRNSLYGSATLNSDRTMLALLHITQDLLILPWPRLGPPMRITVNVSGNIDTIRFHNVNPGILLIKHNQNAISLFDLAALSDDDNDDPNHETKQPRMTMVGYNTRLEDFVLTPDGSRLITVGVGSTFMMWDLSFLFDFSQRYN